MTITLLPVPTACPTCRGKLWDNRLTKKNPKAPDFKCRDKACDGCVWTPQKGEVWADSVQAAPQNNIALAVQKAAMETLDLVPYGDPLPGKHGSPAKLPPHGLGSVKGNPDWMDELFHVYAACHADAAQYSTIPEVQASIAATLFIQAAKAHP